MYCRRKWLAVLILVSGTVQLLIYEMLNTFNSKQRTADGKGYGWNLFDVVCMKTIQNESDLSYWVEKYFAYEERPSPADTYSDNHTILPQCDVGFTTRHGFTSAVMDEELDFAIAFSILVFKDPQQSVRLLRAIWRPHNVYCIHVDAKSNEEIKTYIQSRVKCLDNVFFSPRAVDVRWGKFSVLEADLICMEALYKHKTRWKYFINLTGQEFPLKTNYELVKILTLYAGGNDIFGQFHKLDVGRLPQGKAPPHGIRIAKGPVHIVASRSFVEYVLYNETARDLLEYTKLMKFADEHFFSSLNNNPHLRVPGSLTGIPKRRKSSDFFHSSKVRFKIFSYHKNDPACTSRVRHYVCIFGVGDLPRLTRAPHLFVNKFHQTYQPFAYDCLEHWLVKKIHSEKHGHRKFDLSPYKNMYFINNCYCPDTTE